MNFYTNTPINEIVIKVVCSRRHSITDTGALGPGVPELEVNTEQRTNMS